MTTLLIVVLVALVGLGLILAGLGHESARRDLGRLRRENTRLRRLIRSIEVEARTQFSAGNNGVEYLLDQIATYREESAA